MRLTSYRELAKCWLAIFQHFQFLSPLFKKDIVGTPGNIGNKENQWKENFISFL